MLCFTRGEKKFSNYYRYNCTCYSWFYRRILCSLISYHYFIIQFLNKQELQQVSFNHSSANDFKRLYEFLQKCTLKPCSFMMINTTLASDNPLRFRDSLFEKNIEVTKKINDKIRDGKLQHDINKEDAKKSALSPGKIEKYRYLTGQEIVPSKSK